MGVRLSKSQPAHRRARVKTHRNQLRQLVAAPSRAIIRRLKPDPSPRLPPEVIDTIIDFLYKDPHTLRSFLLVSSQFLLSCRYHLHYFTIIRARDSGQWNSKDFVQILRTSTEIGHFIKKLFVTGGTTHHVQRQGQMTAGLFGEILQLLPNLTWVGFSGVQFREQFNRLPSFHDVLQPSRNSIRNTRLPYLFIGELSLNATEWEIPELIRFLSLFSHIGTLNAKGVRGLDNSEDGATADEDDAEVLEAIYLTRVDSLASLVSHLTIDQYATFPQDLPLIQQIMRHIANSETTRALS